MRFLLILLAIPGIALAQAKSRNHAKTAKKSIRPQVSTAPVTPVAQGPLAAPTLLQPPAGYPLNGQLGNYNLLPGQQLGTGLPGQSLPPGHIPGYLAHFNRGIPGFGGVNQAPSGFNILTYNQPQRNQSFAPANGGGGGMGNLGNLLSGFGGGNNGGNNGFGNNAGSGYNSGSSYSSGSSSGNYSGTPVNSGPDGLCYQQGLFQTTPKSELGGRTPCQVIADTIEDSCTGQFADSLAEGQLDGMEDFCPGWNRFKVNKDLRTRILTALVAATVRTESSWRPDTVGDGGTSRGLLQLTVASDRGKGCSCGNLNNEFNIGQNLRCGTHMMISYMANDRTVGRGQGQNASNPPRGIARSFGPYRDGRRERPDIIRRVSNYCRMLEREAPPAANPEAIPMS